MKRFVMVFLLAGVACATSNNTGTNTTRDVVNDNAQTDSGMQDLAKELAQNDTVGEVRHDITKHDIIKSDPGKEIQGTDVNEEAGDMEIYQQPKCTLSPDDQTGYTISCDKVCVKILSCSKDGGDISQMRKDCLFRCKAFRVEAKVEVANTFGKCVVNADCSNGDPIEQCQGVVETYAKDHQADVTTDQQADCQAFATALQDCGELDEAQATEFSQTCVSMWAVLRPKALQRVVACSDSSCSSIRDCYSQALCVDMWSLPQNGSSESSETVEPDQDAFVGHDVMDTDVVMPDINIDMSMPDMSIPDMTMPDVVMPDVVMPDINIDVPMPDMFQYNDVVMSDTSQYNDVPHLTDIPTIDAYMACKEYPAQTGFAYTSSEICSKQKQCNATANVQECLGLLATIKKYVSISTVDAVGKCVMDTKCLAVPSGQDILDWCPQQITIQPTQQQENNCEALATKAAGCGWNKDETKQNCLQTVTQMRQEVVDNYLACKDMDCAHLDSCMYASACMPLH